MSQGYKEMEEEVRMVDIRTKYFNSTGQYSTDEEILMWWMLHHDDETKVPTMYGKRFSEVVEDTKSKYDRPCKGIYIDVYDVLLASQVKNPATQHAIKKLLASGQRGYKDEVQDLEEARDSIVRAIELTKD